MKKLFKISLCIVAFLLFTFAVIKPLNMAGNWYQQFLPNIGSQQINDIYFIDSLTGFIVTSKNVNPDTANILKTTNGGNNWQVVSTLAPRRFTRVKFINSLTGFISGGSGSGTPFLYKSTDGGNNWSAIPGATLGTALWDDMSVLNTDTIWLVDDNSLNGGVFRTTNGGANWTQQINLGSQNPSKIYMYNGRIGLFSSTAGLYKTTNSGINWLNVSNDFSFSDMFFIDSLTGWKASFFIKKTTNGGLNWVNQPLPTGNFLGQGAVDFMNADNDTIWAVGETILIGTSPPGRGIIYRTTNGGNNWLFQVPDTSIHIFAYRFGQIINNKHGWAYNTVTGIHTTNGGDIEWLTNVEQISGNVPEKFQLMQNYPNPFNPITNIKYSVKRETSNVKLIVYDIQGKLITILVNEEQSAGTYKTDWDASGFSSGIYLYSLIIEGRVTDTKKLVLIK